MTILEANTAESDFYARWNARHGDPFAPAYPDAEDLED